MPAGDIINASDVTGIVGVQLGTVASPVTTASNGTTTSGTTETRDAVLGDYVFTVPVAQATYRYRAVLAGRGLSGSTVGDRFAVRIRDGGSSSPTAASTLFGHDDTVIISSVSSPETFYSAPTFVPGSGVHTLSVFTVRLSGTGIAIPSGVCEFYVECLGPN